MTKEHYQKRLHRNAGFEEWFIGYQRDTAMDCMQKPQSISSAIYLSHKHG